MGALGDCAYVGYEDYPIRWAGWRRGLTRQQIRWIGNIEDGVYLVAINVNGVRYSNVAELTIDSNADLSSEPTLQLLPLPLGVLMLAVCPWHPADRRLSSLPGIFPTLLECCG